LARRACGAEAKEGEEEEWDEEAGAAEEEEMITLAFSPRTWSMRAMLSLSLASSEERKAVEFKGEV
jgi:hypothetical protein